MYIYIYVCVHIYIYIYIYICVCVCVCVRACVYNPIIPSRNIGPLRGFFHLTLFPAVCFVSFQDFPIIFASSSIVLLHVTFGLPRPRLPCGFQSKASRATVFRSAVYEVYGPAIPTSDTEFSKQFWFVWILSTGRSLTSGPARICVRLFGGIYW
jgi:hypothetical protein